MNFVAFEVEGLPDLAGARPVFGLEDEIDDKVVGKIVFHHHLHHGGDSAYLAPHLRAIAAVSMVLCRDEEPRLVEMASPAMQEMGILREIDRMLARPGIDVVFWDGGRGLADLLRLRALVQGVALDAIAAAGPLLEGMENAVGASRIPRVALAARLGIPCDAVPDDETNWRHSRGKGLETLARRCRLNALATARLWLRRRRCIGQGERDECAVLDERLAALALSAVPSVAPLSAP